MSRWLPLAVAGLLAWGTGCRPPAPAVPVPKDLDRLDPQLRAHVNEMLGFVRAAPRNAARHATLGLAYSVNGLWEEARQAFQNAIQLDDREPLAHLYLAVALQETGRADEALAMCLRLTERFRSFPQGFYQLGFLSLRAGHLNEAEPAYRRLTELSPQEWRGWSGLGEVKLRQGDLPEAIRLLEKARQLAPAEPLPHHLLGQAYQRAGRAAEAEPELRLGVNAAQYPMPDPWSRTAPLHMKLLPDQFQMADGYLSSGEPLKAVQLLEAALKFHPTNPAVINQLAVASNQAGQPERARALLLGLLDRETNNAKAVVTLSFTFQQMGSNALALAHAERAIALSSNTALPYIARANALVGMERDDEALAALETAASIDPQNPDILTEMGDVRLLNLHQPAAAIEIYRRALALDPTLTQVWVRLADVLLHEKQTNEAQAAIQKLQALAPNEPALKKLLQRANPPGPPS